MVVPPLLRRSLVLVASLGLALAAGAPTSGHAQPVDPDLLSAMEARSIGPAGMSGRIATLDVVGSGPATLWVGAATGGVWRSDNEGITWRPVFDDQRLNGIGAVAVHPDAPEVIWVGTGEGNPRNSAGVGAGLYRSVDAGGTWELVGFEGSERIHRIVIHPRDPDVVWVGIMGPAWSDGGERGVWKTTDGGETWRQVLAGDARTGVADLVLDPSNPEKLFAALWEFRREPWFFTSGGPGSGLYVSRDGGKSWERRTEEDGLPAGELGRIGLAVAQSDPSVVYALVEAEESALLRSEDGGATFETVNDDRGVANRPFYYADIHVDPENENRLYNLNSRLWRSEDGGRSFENITRNVHLDFHAMWLDPEDGDHLWVGTDGGIYESVDGGDRWRFVENLPVGQFYHVSVDEDVPFNVYGGMQDNGSWKGPSDVWAVGGIRNAHWTEVAFGDGFNTLVDPRDPEVGYAMSQGGNLMRFDTRTGERKPIRPWAPDSVELRFAWNAAIALDPHDVGTVYYGSQMVHKSTDGGDTWQIISGDLTTDDPQKQRQEESGGLTTDATGAENHTTLLAIAPSPVEPGLVWTGSDDGKVHVTRGGGGTWTDVTDEIGGVPDHTWIPHVEASRHAAGRAYVVFDDHRRGNWEPYLYRTDDYGDGWDRIADEDDIDGFLHTLEEDPVEPRLLFAGGEFGLWVTLDGGEEWFKWTHGLPPAPVRSLVVHPRDHDLVVGTHGRAIWILDDIRPLRALAGNPTLAAERVHLFETPPAYLHHVAATDGYHFSADAAFGGETRPRGGLLTFWVGEGVTADSAEVVVTSSAGETVRTLSVPAARGLNRVTWDLREDLPEEAGEHGEGLTGARVVPGEYTVTVLLDGSTSSRPLVVRPDPRREVAMAEREEKRAAVRRALVLRARLNAVGEAEEEVREGVERVRGALLDQGADPASHPLLEEADSLLARLDRAADREEVGRYLRSVRGLGSSFDAPTEGQALDLARMEDALTRLEERVNGFLAVDAAGFRRRVEEAGLSLFPEPERVGR